MTTKATCLLRSARAVLDGTHEIAQASRAAAVLARQALEDVVVDLCRSSGADLRATNMRTRLVCLRVLVGETVADLAGSAWSSLSQVCHHHAFQLAPTAGEVGYLIALVEKLISDTGGPNTGHGETASVEPR